MISFNCACGEQLAAAPEHAGMRVQCPKCKAVLVIPKPESEFEYADDPAPPPPKKKPKLVDDDDPPPRKSAAPPPPPKKKPKLVDDDDERAGPSKKKAALVEDEDEEDDRPKKKKKKKKRNYGDDDEPEHVRALMAKANAELDEEEERHRREGGGIHFTPGIIAGLISILLGLTLLVVMVCTGFIWFYGLILCGFLIIGGGVRVVLSFTGQGTD